MYGRPRFFWISLATAVECGADPHQIADRHGVIPSTLAWWRTAARREVRGALPAMLSVIVRPAPAARTLHAWPHVELAVAGATPGVLVGAAVACVAVLARALERTC